MSTAAAPRVHHKPDEADRALLNQLQAGLAFVRAPFAEIGSRIGMLHEGRMVEISTPAEFVRSSQAEVKSFLDSQFITREGTWEKELA